MSERNVKHSLARLTPEFLSYARGIVKGPKPRRALLAGLAAALLMAPDAVAQNRSGSGDDGRGRFDPAVTASLAKERVRFAAPNGAVRLKLEVLSENGQTVFEAATKGSVLDWTLSDSQGGRLADGQYLCVITAKDVAGRLSQRLTLVGVAGEVVTVRPASPAEMTARQAEAVGPVEAEAAGVVAGGGQDTSDAPAAALLAHDGTDGQLVTTTGDLVFRGGDFFTGSDKELMRLTSDGSLEVAGTLSARGGIRFADGTVLESAGAFGSGGRGAKPEKAGGPAAADDGAATPSATVDRLAKFTSAEGALGDSAVTESGGNVGVGRSTGLAYRLEVLSASTAAGVRSVSTATLGASSGGGMALETNALPTGPNQRLGAFFWGASNGTTTYNPALLAGYSAEAWTSARRGAYFEFEATPVGSAARSKVFRVAATGQAGLFNAPSSSVRGLVVRGAASQTANLQEWQDQAGGALSVIDPAGNLGVGTATPAKRLTVSGDAEVGTGHGDYRHLRLGGGNSSGFFYGSFPRYGDGIHMGYNYYADAAGNHQVIQPDGATSRLTTGYGFIALATGGGGSPPVDRVIVDNSGLLVPTNIRVGSTGQYRATVGEENLRIVRGVVDGGSDTPVILAGSGFSASKLSSGDYQITFNTCFSGTPAVVATADQYVSARAITNQFVGSCSFQLHIEDDANRIFHFIAIGPR